MSQLPGAVPGALRILYHQLARRAESRARPAPRVNESPAHQQLARIKRAFVQGYQAALVGANDQRLARKLNQVDADLRGFAVEGATATLAARDLLRSTRAPRLPEFLRGAGAAHIYAGHIGVGWVVARLPVATARSLSQLDPLLCWLAIDGYGFHEGYVHPARTVRQQRVPRRLTGYACRAFDQGLGRSFWFLTTANVVAIADLIEQFEPRRRADLWSGVGLACTYAGGVEPAALEVVWERAGAYQADVALGSALAAKARERGGCSSAYTERACMSFTGLSAQAAARLTDEALNKVVDDGAEPAYALWRARIRASF